MTLPRYRPDHPVVGPAYGLWFKLQATVISLGLAGYGVSMIGRFPTLEVGLDVKVVLLIAALMLGISYYWFLKSRTIIDEQGIRQTWLYNKQVAWSDIRGVKMIGIPYAGWIFPPRLVVRTGHAFMTFNGGSPELLREFANIALVYKASQ